MQLAGGLIGAHTLDGFGTCSFSCHGNVLYTGPVSHSLIDLIALEQWQDVTSRRRLFFSSFYASVPTHYVAIVSSLFVRVCVRAGVPDIVKTIS